MLTLRGVGYFEIANTTGSPTCPTFRAFIYNKQVESNGLVIPVDLFIMVAGNYIQIKRDLTVLVNGAPVQLEHDINGGQITISQTGDYVVVDMEGCGAEFAFTVQDDLSKTFAKLPGTLFNNIQGLCGNFDGDPADDLALSDGTLSDDRNLISDSYKMDALPLPFPNVP